MVKEALLEFDRHEIVDLTYRYATAIDLKDESLLLGCLAETVEARGSGSGPMGVRLLAKIIGSSRPVAAIDFASEIMVGMRRMGTTQHLFSNHQTSVVNDVNATCRFYMRAVHFAHSGATAAPYEVGGFYQHDLAKVDGEWRISFWRLHLSWEYGNYAALMGRKRCG